MDATISMSMKWTDPRLRWNPQDFDNVRHIKIHPNNVWVPGPLPMEEATKRSCIYFAVYKKIKKISQKRG